MVLSLLAGERLLFQHCAAIGGREQCSHKAVLGGRPSRGSTLLLGLSHVSPQFTGTADTPARNYSNYSQRTKLSLKTTTGTNGGAEKLPRGKPRRTAGNGVVFHIASENMPLFIFKCLPPFNKFEHRALCGNFTYALLYYQINQMQPRK